MPLEIKHWSLAVLLVWRPLQWLRETTSLRSWVNHVRSGSGQSLRPCFYLLPHCSSCMVYPSQSSFYLIMKTNCWLPANIITGVDPVATSGSGCQAVQLGKTGLAFPGQRHAAVEQKTIPKTNAGHYRAKRSLKQGCKKKKSDKDCFIRTVIFISVCSVHQNLKKNNPERPGVQM